VRLFQEHPMPKILKSLAVLLALPLLLVGCKINSINYFPPTPAHLRIVNALGTTTPIDVIANGVTLWSGLGFEAMTGYLDIENVTTNFQVKLSGVDQVIVQQTYNPAGDQNYTLVVYGTTTVPSLGVMADAMQPPPSGKFALNVYNAAPIGNGSAIGTISVDFYLTPPGQLLENASPNFTYIAFNSGNIFGQFDAGQYQLRLTVAGTKSLVYDSGILTYPEKTATDIILYSRGSEVLPNVLLNDSDGAGQQRIANNLLARVKAVNGAFQTGNVNLSLNGTAVVSDLAYKTASTYRIIPAGTGTVTFEASAAPGAVIASLSNNFLGATDQSVFVTGFAGSTTAVALRDNNLPPGPSSAAIRYVNASPDAGTLDVYANDVLQASSIATNTASNYVQILSGTYTLTFKNRATGQTVLALPSIGFNVAQTYSVYVVGPAGSLAGLATADSP
jgi:hypothetical protein